MHADILIFAVIAAFLIYRLNSVLGTKHGDERRRSNPFSANKAPVAQTPAAPVPLPVVVPLKAKKAPEPAELGEIIDSTANKDGRIETGLSEIALADPLFDPHAFLQGARMAFEMIVTAFSKGDIAPLKPFVSPRLFADFAAAVKEREEAGRTTEVIIHRIKAARIVEAHLGGVMAYVTVDFDVEETTFARDSKGEVVEGDPNRIFTVEDVWTFSRDVRADDPNWTLIETRAVEK